MILDNATGLVDLIGPPILKDLTNNASYWVRVCISLS